MCIWQLTSLLMFWDKVFVDYKNVDLLHIDTIKVAPSKILFICISVEMRPITESDDLKTRNICLSLYYMSTQLTKKISTVVNYIFCHLLNYLDSYGSTDAPCKDELVALNHKKTLLPFIFIGLYEYFVFLCIYVTIYHL